MQPTTRPTPGAYAAPAPRLCPNLAEAYRAHVAQLAETLASDDAAEAREIVRRRRGIGTAE